MNSKKLWHSFALLTAYLFFVTLSAYAFSRLFHGIPWGIPFALGVCIWIFAIVCLFLREKAALFKALALPCTALACALWLSAFIVGKTLTLSPLAFLLFTALVAVCYLALMALLSLPKISEYLWYQILIFILWIAGSALILAFLAGAWLELFHFSLPELGFFVTVFSILLGFLALGSMLEAESFAKLWFLLSIPMLVATGAVGLLVLLVLTGADSCDCDCGDCGCGEQGGGKRKTTKSYSTSSPTTFSDLSKGL